MSDMMNKDGNMQKLFQDSEEDIKNKIDELRNEIEKCSEYYYAKNDSLVSDIEFDQMLKELAELEKKYPQFKVAGSPTELVGSSLKDSKFQKVRHKKPMLSLSNSYNINDVTDFAQRIYKILPDKKQELAFALELKLDGASISLQYEKGKLVRGVTRGDGIEGEDVTDNIYAIKTIPKKIKEELTFEIRGEIVLPRSKFEAVNEKKLANGEEIFANPRNAASGTLRQIDSGIVAERGLDAYFYFLVDADQFGIKRHSESIKYLEKLGFQTTGICEIMTSMADLEKRIEFWREAREELDYDTDGMVIKLDNMDLWEEVGYTTKCPRWAIAYKFPAKQVSTTLNDITWQVGRTGKLTPVAELEEVELSGSKIKRASLHNMDEIQRKDIRIGDRVFIEKAAEIIPQVVSAIKEFRTGKEKEVSVPTICPVCGGPLEKEEGLVDLKCVNEHCPAIIQGTLEYFVSRDGMNIIGLGGKIIEKLTEIGMIRDVTDIYKLKDHREELIGLEKMGEKSVDNMLEAIEASKNRPYTKTLYALGIPFVGKFLGDLLAKESGDIKALSQMSKEDLLEIDGVGDKVAEAVYSFFRTQKNMEIVTKLQEQGINFTMGSKTAQQAEKEEIFKGKTFLFTGKLEKFKREEVKDIIGSLGGTNLSSVSKKLDYLIVGAEPGSKLAKARDIGTIKILTEDEFIALCEEKL